MISIESPSSLAYCHSPYAYVRRRTHVVMVGDVGIGGDNPIRVQSMTTTNTLDTEATVAQTERLVRAGCEIVRITAQTTKEARNLGEIKARLRAKGITVPLVADIHFSPEAALEAANHVEKVRINPGNYADVRKFAVRTYTDAEYAAELNRIEERFAPLVLRCKDRGIALRIGTNHGSLSDRIVNRYGDTPDGMVESALEFARICEKYGYSDVVFSMKASNPKVMIAAYRLLAARLAALGWTYPFHLGVTEAGNGVDGRIKSVIGIGSLLADGIGDTIRVSLTEEPEAEIPVAFLLANRFTPRDDQPADGSRRPTQRAPLARFVAVPSWLDAALPASAPPLVAPEDGAPSAIPASEASARDRAPRRESGWAEGAGSSALSSPSDTGIPLPRWDPFHYERRVSRMVQVGPVALGGDKAVGVVARVGPDGEARLLRWASPGARRLRRPDVVEWPLPDPSAEWDALAALKRARTRLSLATSVPLLSPTSQSELPKLALLASSANPTRLEEALPFVDAVLLRWLVGGPPGQDTFAAASARLAHAAHAAGKPLWLEVEVAPCPPRDADSADSNLLDAADRAVRALLAAAAAGRAAGQRDLVLAVTAPTADLLIRANRLLAAYLARANQDPPIFLRSAPTTERLLEAALPLGSLLADGIGDAVQAGTPEAGQSDVDLTFDVLQGVGTRLSKTDYVACPSCGRTLFDLQSTTERIKAKTSHLVGVKIAIMGCVVNGPGEMADADFGYVGGAPGQVNLYVGKTCVERGVPAEVADERLIALIKSHGRWRDPEPDEDSAE